MILGRVFGSVYSTIHHEFYNNRILLLIDKLDRSGNPTGDYLIAVDTVGAGAGETVIVIDEGNSARQMIGDPQAPLRSVVAGIVDQVNS